MPPKIFIYYTIRRESWFSLLRVLMEERSDKGDFDNIKDKNFIFGHYKTNSSLIILT